jgi:hypothetical protein
MTTKYVSLFGLVAALSATVIGVGCSAGTDASGVGAGPGSGGGDTSSTGQFTTSSGGECNTGADDDYDGDGFTVSQGDCNDCDQNVNPGSVEIVTADGPPADEDCDGFVDVASACDDGIALTDTDPMNAARAIGLCKQAEGNGWGVISAAYVRANGTPAPSPGAHVGILPEFGPNVAPRSGSAMLGLSSGYARDANDPGACAGGSCGDLGMGTAPPGFPQDVPSCSGSTDINDDIGLELRVRAPSNVQSYSYEFKFHSIEFPEYVCTEFNDQYIALVQPPPQGSINGNISFDSNTNPVSVNIAFFDVCDPSTASDWASICQFDIFGSGDCPPLPNPYCPSGPSELAGTLFEQDGGTSWLVTTAPVDPGGEFTIRFAIWDTGDTALDSTVLIDNFRWSGSPGDVGTIEVPK